MQFLTLQTCTIHDIFGLCREQYIYMHLLMLYLKLVKCHKLFLNIYRLFYKYLYTSYVYHIETPINDFRTNSIHIFSFSITSFTRVRLVSFIIGTFVPTARTMSCCFRLCQRAQNRKLSR